MSGLHLWAHSSFSHGGCCGCWCRQLQLSLQSWTLSADLHSPGAHWALAFRSAKPPMKSSYISEDFGFSSFQQEESAPLTEVPEEIRPFPTPQGVQVHQPEDPEAREPSSTQEDASTQSTLSLSCWNLLFFVRELYSDIQPLLRKCLVFNPGEELSSAAIASCWCRTSFSPVKGPAQPLQLSINHEATISPLNSGEVQHPVLLEHEMERCSFWRRQLLWLWDICWTQSYVQEKCGIEDTPQWLLWWRWGFGQNWEEWSLPFNSQGRYIRLGC